MAAKRKRRQLVRIRHESNHIEAREDAKHGVIITAKKVADKEELTLEALARRVEALEKIIRNKKS